MALPKHIAIIPDGNRRWAKTQRLSPWEGHVEGVKRYWDTANFSSPENVELKKLEYQIGEQQQIAQGVVNNVLNNSFIKELKDVVQDTNDALTQLSETLKDYYLKEQAIKLKQSFISSDDFVHNLQVAESSLITYLLLNYGKFNGFLINQYKSLYFGETNLAQFILQLQKNKKNPALEAIQVDKGLIKLKTRPTDTYTQNVLTSSFKELFQDGTPITINNTTLLTSDVAQRIILSQLLQYGVGYNRESLLEFLPNEYVKPILSQASNYLSQSQEWYNSDAFYKLNINDDRIVPKFQGIVKEEVIDNDILVTYVFGNSAPETVLAELHNMLNEEGINPQERAIGLVLPEFKYSSKPYMKSVTKDATVLFKRVEENGQPLAYMGRPIFKAVQNLSNSPLINYTPSVRELTDQEVVRTFENNSPEGTLNFIKLQDLKNSSEFDEDVVSLPQTEDMRQELPFNEDIKTNEQKINFQEEPTFEYRNRTIKNASADATIALAVDFNSAGEKLTKSSVLSQNKKYIPIDANTLTVTKETVDKIVEQLNSANAKTLNIAGNGIYTMKGKYTQQQVDDFTYDLLNQVINSSNLKTKIESIRSGGQTGFDEAGAKAGIRLGLPTIVLAPKGYTFRNISGQDISNEQQFKDRFKFVEQPINKEIKPKIDISSSTKKSPYFEKDKKKFTNANKLIARGSKDSSSEAYRIAVGDKANTGNYTSSDIVAISVEGNRTGRIKPDYKELEKAVEANVTFITDNTQDRNRSYNIGEREVGEYLESKGYSENGNGIWTKKQKIDYLKYSKLIENKKSQLDLFSQKLTEKEFNNLPIENQQALIYQLENC